MSAGLIVTPGATISSIASESGLPVATATLDEHVEHPLGFNWLLLDSTARRSLMEVADRD